MITKETGLEKELPTLCDVVSVTDKKVERLNLQVSLDAKAVAHLASAVRNHLSNCHSVNGGKGDMQKHLREMKLKVRSAKASADQFRQTTVL